MIADRVKAIIMAQLGIDDERFDYDASLEELGANELDFVELIMTYQREFGISIPDEHAERILTVKDAVEYVQTYGK